MALLFADSFQHYNTSQITRKYQQSNNATIQTTGGRANGPCMRLDLNEYVRRPFTASSTVIVGVRVYTNMTAGNYELFNFLDVNTEQCQITISGTGFVQLARGGTTLGISSNALQVDTWYYIEAKVTIGNAAGGAVVRVNGNEWLNVTGVDTQGSANSTTNSVTIGSLGTGCLICDLYIANTTGGTITDFLGPQRIDAKLFTADGAHSEWTRSGGANNYSLVDDSGAADDDTTYLSSSTSSQRFSVKTTSLGYTPTAINAVQLNVMVKKSDAGTIDIKRLMRSGGTDYLSSTLQAPDISYTNIYEVLEQNPATSSAFTQADIESTCEWGLQIV